MELPRRNFLHLTASAAALPTPGSFLASVLPAAADTIALAG
jgi:hypothetical protein